MNRETNDLILLFTSTFVGATIAFLAVLVTFTFHHEIRERLILRGLIVPLVEPRPANPALRLLLEHWQQAENKENAERNNALPRHAPLYVLHRPGHVPGLPVVRLPPNYPEDDPNRYLWCEDFPAAFAAWRNRDADPWAQPPDRGPRRLPTDGMIWDPHPQYILDWDQPVALEQQPVDAPPQYARCPEAGESSLVRTRPRLRRTNRIPFPTLHRAIGLPSTSNDDPTTTSDTNTLVNEDIPEAIRVQPPPDVPRDIDPDEDQRNPRELLGLEH